MRFNFVFLVLLAGCSEKVLSWQELTALRKDEINAAYSRVLGCQDAIMFIVGNELLNDAELVNPAFGQVAESICGALQSLEGKYSSFKPEVHWAVGCQKGTVGLIQNKLWRGPRNEIEKNALLKYCKAE